MSYLCLDCRVCVKLFTSPTDTDELQLWISCESVSQILEVCSAEESMLEKKKICKNLLDTDTVNPIDPRISWRIWRSSAVIYLFKIGVTKIDE